MKSRLLLIDDTKENRTHLGRRLIRDGYEVLTAESGAAGLETLELNEVAAVILDVMMPDMSGIEVLKVIRSSHPANELPVIMLSANTDTSLKVQALQLGANDYLGKPVEYEFLVAKLQMLLPKKLEGAHQLTEGQVLGHFLLKKLLGQGGMGKVFQATDLRLLRDVAIKVTLESTDPLARQRFLREGRAVAQISHPNVVSVYEIGESPLPYMVMEMVSGVSLETLPKPVPLDQARSILTGICRALKATHSKGIWHRDLKPSNIMLDGDGQVKVMDFGLAQFCSGDHRLTATGEILGTVHYMAPEHFQESFGQVDQASDIFALGGILFELLTGTTAFGAENLTHIMFAIISHDPELPKETDAQLAKICLRCLEKDKSLRYSQAQEILDELLSP